LEADEEEGVAGGSIAMPFEPGVAAMIGDVVRGRLKRRRWGLGRRRKSFLGEERAWIRDRMEERDVDLTLLSSLSVDMRLQMK
jgi:hypothetical protein